MIKIKNFDFLVGRWTVINRRLEERLNGCDKWIEFPGEMETRKILNGLGLTDEMKTPYFDDGFIGLSVRLYDPKSDEWTIYWADTMYPENKLKEQVTGRFIDGIGMFYGKEIFEGKEVKLRFMWKKESLDTAFWEQAYYDEKAGEWEINWTMEFTKMTQLVYYNS